MTNSTDTPAEAPQTLYTALAAFQARIPSLKLGKDAEGQVQSRKYKYLTLEKLHEEAIPALAECGLLWMTIPTDGKLLYRMLHLESGESVEGFFELGEGTPQVLGSAISYFRRYSLLCVTGIVPQGEDDDGLKASEKPAKLKAAKGPQSSPPITEQRKQKLVAKLAESESPDEETALVLAAVGAESLDALSEAQGEHAWGLLNAS